MIKHVLLVEDDFSTQTLFRRMILKIDPQARVRCVSSAEAAYRILNESTLNGSASPYDLVLADLLLPGSNGLVLWDLCRKKFPEVDFVFLSGASYEDWYQRIKSFPIWPQFLRKPISEEKLRQLWEQRYSPPGEFGG